MWPILIPGIAVAVVAAGAAALRAFLRSPLPRTEGTLEVPGLQGRVEVLRDEWGVPHIYATSDHDLFVAQGYIHAQDRLWQMELQRRAGSGRLSEMLGEPTLELDRVFRIVGLNRAAETEIETLDAETHATLEAYTEGVNAYLRAASGRLPLEFKLLRCEPEPWHPVDSLYWAKVMAWNLCGNLASELIRARLAARLGADRAADLEPPFPADNPAIVHGSAPSGTPPPNGWRSEGLRRALHDVEQLFQSASPPSTPPGTDLPGAVQRGGGSNQWVIAGQLSVTGHPLLANDTHMRLQIPAIWYQVHLSGGSYNVTGVSLPGLPGVVVGHNERCAWGMTTAWQDAQDLIIERLNPINPHQYEYRGAWLDAEVIREEIRIKGRAEPLVQEVVVTRHGPIVSSMLGEPVPLALRWVGLEPGRLLRAALRYDRAGSWAEFRSALADWSTPAHNFVYADVDGNIGYLQAGWMPVRVGGGDGAALGTVPLPGWTGEGEWERYLSIDELPQIFNPVTGWLATANNLVVDAAYPHFISADLENPSRARRIADLLTSQTTFSVSDMARFQRDAYSAQAERFVRHVRNVKPAAETERQALDHLARWNYCLDADSVAASLYEVTRLRALHLVFGPHLGDLTGSYVGLGLTAMDDTSPFHDRSLLRLLDLLDGVGDQSWLNDPATGALRSPDDLLHRALGEAIDLLTRKLGNRMERWQWGRLNQAHFAHPVGSVKPLHLIFNRGPYPLGGDRDTLLRAISRPEFPFPPAGVVDALRFVADLSDWEKCRIVIPGGQSGHPSSPHYDDLIALWLRGELQDMPFARENVERHAAQRLALLPK